MSDTMISVSTRDGATVATFSDAFLETYQDGVRLTAEAITARYGYGTPDEGTPQERARDMVVCLIALGRAADVTWGVERQDGNPILDAHEDTVRVAVEHPLEAVCRELRGQIAMLTRERDEARAALRVALDRPMLPEVGA